MGLIADDLWDVSCEAQPNFMSIGEDIGSHSNYPLTSMRRTAPTTWLWWTSLSPRGTKLKPLANWQHDPSESRETSGEKMSEAHAP
jgi:hypothetical protein